MRCKIKGELFESPVTQEQVMAAAEQDDNLGLCLRCGNEQGGCEPDARRYECECCGEPAVYGAEELVLMLL